MRLASLALLAALPGCVIDFGGDDDDEPPPPCFAFLTPDEGLVNPATLECQVFGDECPGHGSGGPPTWGSCESPCRDLDESACLTTEACRATYDHACLYTDGPCPLLTPFLGCQPVDATGPERGPACLGLDAWECSRRDDCLATYTPGPTGGLEFAGCDAELVPACPPAARCG
ncbi:MAG TPA: hypothetical protein VM734_32495 [Kofleriaceae bacterium]|nr:hypothetical protein [Kofleriaceae bacterium]